MNISGSPISGTPISGADTTAGVVILTPLDFLLANPTVQRVYLFESDVSDGVLIEDDLVSLFSVDEEILNIPNIKASTTGYATDEELHNQVYDPTLLNPLNFKSKLFTSKTLHGKSGPGAGDVTLLNGDGSLDGVLHSNWDSGSITIKVGAKDYKYSEFTTIFKGVADGITWDEDKINIRLRDRHSIMGNDHIQDNTFGGTGGCDGCINLVGKPKPLCFGEVYNIEPPLVDVPGLTYQVHDGSVKAIDAVYFSGLKATLDTDYTVDLANGYFTLLVNPNGTVTADVRGDNTGEGYVESVATIMRRIISNYTDLVDSDVDGYSFAIIDAINNATVGFYTGLTDITLSDIFDALISSIGGYWRFTSLDLLQIGIFRENYSIALVLDENVIDSIRRISTPLPVWKTRLGYWKIWSVMNADRLAGGVDEGTALFLSEEFRNVVVEDTSIRDTNPLATELDINTLLIDAGEAQTEADRQQDLFGVSGRSFYEITLHNLILEDIIGKGIKMTYSRFGLDDGVSFIVTGSEVNARTDKQKLTVWG